MILDRIVLGDAYQLIKEVPDHSVDLIMTDPPYAYESLQGGGIMTKRKYNQELMDSGLQNGFSMTILDDFVRVLKKINCYIWCNKNQIYDYVSYFVKKLHCNWEIIVWAKTNPIPFTGGHYLVDKEYCLYFWEKGVPLDISYKTGKTVFMTHTNKEDKKKYGHPTIKPSNIIEVLVRNSCPSGGVTLDPFSGTGTTSVACKRLGIHYVAFEINETFYEVSCERLKES